MSAVDPQPGRPGPAEQVEPTGDGLRELETWIVFRPAVLLYAAAVGFTAVFVGVAVLSERWEPLTALMFFAASFTLTVRGHRRRLRAIRERDPHVTTGYGVLVLAWVLLIACIYLPFVLMQALES